MDIYEDYHSLVYKHGILRTFIINMIDFRAPTPIIFHLHYSQLFMRLTSNDFTCPL